ncbi:MAG: TAXI family TRAP transporter solute-binding subunit [Planctomycetota bacterium]
MSEAAPAPPAPPPPPPPQPRQPDTTGFKDALKVWLPIGLVGMALCFFAWSFVEPAPPGTVTLSTGAPGGAYEAKAQRYASAFDGSGIALRLLPSAGSAENVQRLLDGEADAALVQAGTVPENADETLEAVVAVAYEPLLVFVRTPEDLSAANAPPTDAATGGASGDTSGGNTLGVLSGKRVAIGGEGSGTAALINTLLDALQLRDTADATGTTLLPLGGRDAAAALKAGDLDAACFVMDPDSPLVTDLLAAPGVSLLDLRRSPAWSHRLPYLEAVTIDEGVIDPVANLPKQNVRTVAPVAYLAVRRDTHRAVVQLLVEAAKDDPEARSLVAAPGSFPSLQRMDLPVADEAEFFFERGPNFLHRLFPFWLASLIDRLIILVLPLLVVLIPLVRAAPPILRWRVRSRIYRWYRELRVIDNDLARADLPDARLNADLDLLRELDDEVAETEVPLSYMEEFYNLRLHVAYMRQRVEQRLEGKRLGVDPEEFKPPAEA